MWVYVGYNESMRLTVKAFRKFIILLIGLPVVVIGMVLLPLPGPGLLVIFLGLLLLSHEFDWAERYLVRIRLKLKEIIDKHRPKP